MTFTQCVSYFLPFSGECDLMNDLTNHIKEEQIMFHGRAINWLYVVNMEISMVKTKVGCYGNQILALQPCGGNPYGA